MTTTTPAILRRTLTVLAVGGASLALAGCSLLGNITGGNTDSGTDSGTGTDVDVFTIAVGDCLNDGGAEGEVSTVPTVDCAEPHDSEAYASVLMDDGEFPGDVAVTAFGDEQCATAFDSFVGLAFADSTLTYSYYYPTEESWASGDREILCLLIDPAGQVEGSLKGAAR